MTTSKSRSGREASGSRRAGWLLLCLVGALGFLGAGRYFFPNDPQESKAPPEGIPERCLQAHAQAGDAAGSRCPYKGTAGGAGGERRRQES